MKYGLINALEMGGGRILSTCGLAAALTVLPCHGVVTTFGSGGNQFTMEFVDISGGNLADDTGYGAVSSNFRVGVHEVSRDMIGVYNAQSGGPMITMADLSFVTGGIRTTMPASGVSWNEAARFVNWLNTSSGYSAAYNILGAGANDSITLWTASDPGFNPDNPFRNANAFYFLPSEDEWYRAAYYDPTVGRYWDYATGSDVHPVLVSEGIPPGTDVLRQAVVTGPADITNAGGLSPFGTMAQGGNVWEWTESAFEAPNDSADATRAVRGGFWWAPTMYGLLHASNRDYGFVDEEEINFGHGFRVASIPEPSALSLVLLAASCFAVWGRHR